MVYEMHGHPSNIICSEEELKLEKKSCLLFAVVECHNAQMS